MYYFIFAHESVTATATMATSAATAMAASASATTFATMAASTAASKTAITATSITTAWTWTIDSALIAFVAFGTVRSGSISLVGLEGSYFKCFESQVKVASC